MFFSLEFKLLKTPPLIIYIFFYFLEESTSRVPFKIIWGLVGALALAILVTIIVISLQNKSDGREKRMSTRYINKL